MATSGANEATATPELFNDGRRHSDMRDAILTVSLVVSILCGYRISAGAPQSAPAPGNRAKAAGAPAVESKPGNATKSANAPSDAKSEKSAKNAAQAKN